MATKRKQQFVAQFSDDLSTAKSVVFTDPTGLSTTGLEELRVKVANAGGKYTITKNTLLKIAMGKQGLSRELVEDEALRGPTATLFSLNDEVAAIKALSEFLKDHERPAIKGGLLRQEFIDANKVLELAKLPSFNELVVQLIARVQSPATTLVMQLNTPLRRLIMDLRTVSQSKGGA